MCRYTEHNYRQKYVCLECRLCFKGRGYCPCPECGEPMQQAGRDFAAPRRQNVRAWRVVERLFEAGVHFFSCGCGGPGFRPRIPSAVTPFLESEKDKWEKGGKKLLRKIGRKKSARSVLS